MCFAGCAAMDCCDSICATQGTYGSVRTGILLRRHVVPAGISESPFFPPQVTLQTPYVIRLLLQCRRRCRCRYVTTWLAAAGQNCISV